MVDCGAILIVDASAEFRAFASRLLQLAGYVTVDTGHGI